MTIKTLKFSKPNTPGTRGVVRLNKSHLWKGSSEKSLTKIIKNTGGRNNLGRITCYGKRSVYKKLYRQIDFKRHTSFHGIVERIEYDPNRTAHIALIKNEMGEKKYIIATKNMKPGSIVGSGALADTLEGHTLKLIDIPVGNDIHNIEMYPGKGGQIVRSAGAFAKLVGKELGEAIVELPSKELRYFSLECTATIGIVSNELKFNEYLGKAGANFWRGKRSKVRGIAKNPIDHANGGKSDGGCVLANFNKNVIKGKKTRKRNKWSNSRIISRNRKGKKGNK
jgi:large subunit ribosomal protein L2